jgi:hypothetical protein
MLLTVLLPLLAITAMAQTTYPNCGRRGMFDLSNPASSNNLVMPAIQIDAERCASICGLSPGCGGFASTGKKRPTDWCLIFRDGV